MSPNKGLFHISGISHLQQPYMHSRRKQKQFGVANKNLPKYLSTCPNMTDFSLKIWSQCSIFRRKKLVFKKVFIGKPGLNCKIECPNKFQICPNYPLASYDWAYMFRFSSHSPYNFDQLVFKSLSSLNALFSFGLPLPWQN